jgi:Cu/Ag efflux protein CusF
VSRIQKCARLSAALLATAICAEAADALAFGDHLAAKRTSGAVALAQAQQVEPGGIFRGVGVVTAIDPATGSLTLNHEEIKGLMSAMEMMYSVSPRSLSDGLRQGDKIDFGLEAKTYTIRDVKVIERAK